MKQLFTAGDLMWLTSLSHKTLDPWFTSGIICPHRAAQGRGKHRAFTFQQVIAITYANQWRQAGAGLELFAEIVAYLSQVDLMAEFTAGRTHLLVAPGGMRLVRIGSEVPDTEILNVKEAYLEICERMKTLPKRKKYGPKPKKKAQAA